MKLLQQYLYSVRKHLPYSSRDEIIKELNSQIQDEVEAIYGPDYTEKDLEIFLTTFGSPRKIANQYKSNRYIISPTYTDLYFFILKIIVLAMALSLTIAMIVEMALAGFTLDNVLNGLIQLPTRLFAAVGQSFMWLTIAFILISRYRDHDEEIALDDDWDIKEVKSIQLGEKIPSKLESSMSIFFLTLALIIMNFIPELITLAENNIDFAFTNVDGFKLGHYINLEAFQFVMIFISISILLDIVYHIILLITGQLSKRLSIYYTVKEFLGALLIWGIVFYAPLYVDYENLIGFRAVFVIIAVISTIDFFAEIIKKIVRSKKMI